MHDQGETSGRDARANLARALTFHASFDHGFDADFGGGDRRLYSAAAENGQETGGLTPGPGQPALSRAEGKFGSALQFTLENSHVALFKAAGNVTYSPSGFSGTVAFWMSTDPTEIPERYCDPFQLTDKVFSDACIWLDFTKNDTPPDFRLGCFGDQREWDAAGQGERNEAFYFRLAKVAEPPFARGAWTHVAITWDGLNTSRPGRARLYLNAHSRGATSRVGERFTWDVAQAAIRLGTGHFVGLIDDLACFDRALTSDDVRALYALEQGVADLHDH